MEKYRRRKYLINKSLQLRYMAMVGIFMLIISIATGWAIYYTIWVTLIDRLEGETMLDEIFIDLNRIVLTRTSLLVFAGICIGAVVTMFILHRIAGPLSRVRYIMDQIGNGIVPHRVRFRREDEFQEIAEAMDEAVCKIGEVSEKNLRVIKEASACVTRGIGWLKGEEPEVQRLKEELDHLKKCLEEFEIFRKTNE